MLDFSCPRIMGILNVTPDSFSDGGSLYGADAVDIGRVLNLAGQMAGEGVDIFDVGGESTRPGAEPVSMQMELDRVIPVVEALVANFDIPVSVDTGTPEVMAESVAAGAGLINDVRALRRPGALEAAAGLDVPVCLMHMLGEPGTMQRQPQYEDVVAEVKGFLMAQVATCAAAGIGKSRIILDPGFGFGKTLAHNLALFRALPDLVATGFPVLVGVSRKSMVGAVLDKPVDRRLHGSVALALLAARAGVKLLRVHDVGATADAIKMWQALETGEEV